MINPEAVRRCLEECDVQAAKELWSEKDDNDILIMLHHARTCAASIPDSLRCYSHRWLEERELPSGLPDCLKPKADRLYPRIVSAVGLAVQMRNADEGSAGIEIRTAMENAVLDAEADGRLADSPFVKLRVEEARAKARRILLGR